MLFRSGGSEGLEYSQYSKPSTKLSYFVGEVEPDLRTTEDKVFITPPTPG